MEIDKLKISELDFDLFAELRPKEKLEFLWDAQYFGLEASVLKQLDKVDKILDAKEFWPKIITHEFEVGNTTLCVTAHNNIMYLNSNRVHAIKQFVKKLWLDGHILSAQNDILKTRYDKYKYFRAYKILGKGAPFSQN